MTELQAIRALGALTSTALELITAVNKAALAINARHERGGDFTPEELAAVDAALEKSRIDRDAAIAKRESEEQGPT